MWITSVPFRPNNVKQNKMKKFIKISAIACTAALFLGLVGCTKGELDTAQYSESAVTLASYGPNPVMRGGQLRFFGSNLQNVVEVNVPGVEPITAIEVVESGKTSEIRVTLPVEGPEVGIVTIKTKDGIVLKTKKELTYTEPIVFESFTVAQPAYPGDVITLKGDYMNLVQHVVFEGGETSPVLEGATRHEAKVTIPATAVSGKIILSDGAEVENLLYSTEDLTIGKPSINKLEDRKVTVGYKITFTGNHIEMIKAVEFPKVNETEIIEGVEMINGQITVEVPAVATNGTVTAVSYAGDSFEVVDIECIMPTELVVTNTPKAGSDLIIEGTDLDVVAKVDLTGAENASFVLKEDGKLYVTVPATATTGTAKLFHANGEFVEVDYDIVHPTITNVTPLELYAGDEPVIVEGTDLDLVASAKIGTKDVEIAEKTETKLTLATAVTSVGGNVVLTLANGETLESEQEVKMNYHSKVILTSRPAAQHIGQEVVLKGQSLDLVESIFIGDTKVTQYGLRTPEEIRFLMPWCKVGSYELKFQLYDGDIEVQADPIEVLLEQDIKTIWEGEFTIGGWDGGMQALAWGGYDWSTVSAGTELIVHYLLNPAGDYHQIRAGNGSWVALPSWKLLPGSDNDGNVPVSADGYLSIKLTDSDISELVNNNGLVLCGAFFTVTKVQLVSEIPQERTIWSGSVTIGAWDISMGDLSWGRYDWSTVTAGTELIVHYEINPAGDYHQIRAGNGSWAGLPSWKLLPGSDNDGNVPVTEDGTLSITLTDADLSELVNSGGLVICGAYFTVTAVGLL